MRGSSGVPGVQGDLDLLERREPENVLRDPGTHHFGFSKHGFHPHHRLGFLGSSGFEFGRLSSILSLGLSFLLTQ